MELLQNHKKSNLTARQETINLLIDGARKEVIFAEIQRDFLLDLKKKIDEGTVDSSVETIMFPSNRITSIIESYDANYKFSLEKLNYLKDLRKKEQDKEAVKVAKKIRGTIPSEIKIDLNNEK